MPDLLSARPVRADAHLVVAAGPGVGEEDERAILLGDEEVGGAGVGEVRGEEGGGAEEVELVQAEVRAETSMNPAGPPIAEDAELEAGGGF